MTKTRGLKEAKKKLGDLEKIISMLLKKKKKVKIFESGPGYGKIMMELTKKFGNKVEIIGMNLKPSHGNKKIMVDFALKEKIINKEDLKKIKLPKIIFGDAGKKLPFKSGSIDLVYSQTSTYLYKDKIHFYEEVTRILSKKGIARITLHENPNISKEFLPLLKIQDKIKQIHFEKFIKTFKPIKIIKLGNGKKVIEVKKGKLNFNLNLKSTINTHNINKKWFGIQSIYDVKK
ncbi:MAG: class I SAM-dependent methyltransferase [Nanoarchaeota archaeon]|nr:class I SAM-dependent methyltransferase [Nanoarchaeota archaeon]MBU1027769.1 class I SAM-dependent methyltransferase [Nanoarchaeota archaeon]